MFCGGDPADPALLPIADITIGADSGVDHALAAGWHVDVVVGDLDSIDPRSLEAATASGASIIRYRTDKDATDLELALRHALSLGADRVDVAGGGGGRLDHHLANMLLIAHRDFAALNLQMITAAARLLPVHGGQRRTVPAAVGDIVTIVAVGGDATGVTTAGLEYSLDDAPLPASSSRGVSNVAVTGNPTVEVRSGTILVVVPLTA